MSTEPENLHQSDEVVLDPDEIIAEPLARPDQVLLLLGASLLGGAALGAIFHVVSEIAYALIVAAIFFGLVGSFALTFALRYIKVRSLTIITLCAMLMGVVALVVDYGWDYANFRTAARRALQIPNTADDTNLNEAVARLTGTSGVLGYLVMVAQFNDLTLIGARVSNPLDTPNALAASNQTNAAAPFGLRIETDQDPDTGGFKYVQAAYMILEAVLFVGVLAFAARRSAVELIATEEAEADAEEVDEELEDEDDES